MKPICKDHSRALPCSQCEPEGSGQSSPHGEEKPVRGESETPGGESETVETRPLPSTSLTGEFRVSGDPVPMPRPRAIRKGRPCEVCRTPPHLEITSNAGAKIKEWKRNIQDEARWHMQRREPSAFPTAIKLEFMLPVPSTYLRKNGAFRKGKPSFPIGARSGDVDNFAKAVLDAMNGILYTDDSVVVGLTIFKTWALPPRKPGVLIAYRPYTDPIR